MSKRGPNSKSDDSEFYYSIGEMIRLLKQLQRHMKSLDAAAIAIAIDQMNLALEQREGDTA
jgi:hypothetical protein